MHLENRIHHHVTLDLLDGGLRLPQISARFKHTVAVTEHFSPLKSIACGNLAKGPSLVNSTWWGALVLPAVLSGKQLLIFCEYLSVVCVLAMSESPTL